MTHHLLGTRISDDLAREADEVAALLRSNASTDLKVDRVDELIYRFVQVGIDQHFHEPARMFDLNPLLVKVIDVAAATTLRALRTATRRVLKNLSDEQLREVADEIEDRLYQFEVIEE
jgi:urease beta subunit